MADRAISEGGGELAERLADLWRSYQTAVEEQLQAIELAAARAARRELTPDVREPAIQAAHRMYGSCGVFGLDRAGTLSGQIEQLFIDDPQPAGALDLAGRLRATLEQETARTLPAARAPGHTMSEGRSR